MTNAMMCLVRNKIGSGRSKREPKCSVRRGHARPSASAKCVEPNARASASEYIRNVRWQLLRDLLLSVERANAACACPGSECSHDLAEEDTSTGRTVLHEVLREKKPPIDVVRTILRMFPEMAAIRDDGGHSPLHLAVEFEASMNVLQNLVKANPKSVEVRDGRSRTALMQACERIGALDKSEGAPWGDAEELIEFLLARPSSSRFVLLEDDEGRTTLEIALMREAPASVVSALQKSTKRASEEEEHRRRQRRKSLTSAKRLKTTVKRLSEEIRRSILGSSQAHLLVAQSA